MHVKVQIYIVCKDKKLIFFIVSALYKWLNLMHVKVQIKNKKIIFEWLIYIVCKDKKNNVFHSECVVPKIIYYYIKIEFNAIIFIHIHFINTF